ncbi:MAG: hypothetical protein AVDCRST_MAG74-3644, partial [uncultured Pyrinomonadaceae bacterium]
AKMTKTERKVFFIDLCNGKVKSWENRITNFRRERNEKGCGQKRHRKKA